MSTPTSAEVLSRLVAFDTTSCNSNLPLIDYVADYLAALGIESHRIFDATGQKANLWATIGPADVPGTILSGHTDTVPVTGQEWTSDPFTLTPRGGNLYARGTCDMKGFLACALAAVPKMLAAPLARPIHLAFSYDEEVGCIGVIGLIEWLSVQRVKPDFCVVGEPTMMSLVVGHKAKRSMRITIRGRSCHSSLAPDGVNAVEYGALIVAKMKEIAGRLAASGRQDPAYDVPHSTAHVGMFNGGTALNIVPDEAVILGEFRVLPGEDPDALVAELSDYIGVLDAEMKALAPETGIELDVYAAFPGLATPAESVATARGLSLAAANGTSSVAYGTEGGRFSETLGVPTIICGPGSIGDAHKPDEYISEAQLQLCDRFMERLIDWSRAKQAA